MAEQLEKPFTTATQQLVNLTFTEVLSGTGIQVFYLTTTNDTTGTGYHLYERTDQSGVKETVFGDGTEHNFNTTALNLPRTIFGTAYMSIIGKHNSGGSNMTWRLLKVSGAVETEIATVVNAIDTTEARDFVAMTISTPVHLARGDFIRLEVIKQSNGGTIWLGTNPEGSASTNLTETQTKIMIPFRIE